MSGEAVSLEMTATEPELVVRLALDPAWLADPARVWPVTIDPVVTFTLDPQGSRDAYLAKAAPTTATGYYGFTAIAGGSNAARPILRRNDVDNLFAEPVDILKANVQLYASTDTTASPAQAVAVHEVAATWREGDVTWNQRQAAQPWAAPGGDFRSPAVSVTPSITGPPGYRSFAITSAVQAWVDGERVNDGVILKYDNEAAGTTQVFSSVDSGANRPVLVIQWQPLQAVRDPYAYERFSLRRRSPPT